MLILNLSLLLVLSVFLHFVPLAQSFFLLFCIANSLRYLNFVPFTIRVHNLFCPLILALSLFCPLILALSLFFPLILALSLFSSFTRSFLLIFSLLLNAFSYIFPFSFSP